jgi:hypothetical protein
MYDFNNNEFLQHNKHIPPFTTMSQSSVKKRQQESNIIPLLARRSCHLPGNTWKADWIQYMRNNHILFGICLHHPLHPVEWWERILMLVGSTAFGLAATTCVYLWDVSSLSNAHYDMDDAAFVWGNYAITKGQIILWTFGCLLHSIFDCCVWNIMACACCHPGGRYYNNSKVNSNRYKDCGSYLLIPIVLAVAAVAVIAVLMRASHQQGNDNQNNDPSWTDINYDYEGVQSFSFLSKYGVELALTWSVYAFGVGTIVFSGILGCYGRLPVLGGRPGDIKRVHEELSNVSSGYASI